MDTMFSRTELLLGTETLAALQNHHVLIAGLGGVGSFVAEALGRVGIKHLTLLDHDVVTPSNLNRQLVALHSTLGQQKTTIMAARLRDIYPQIELTLVSEFLHAHEAETFIAQGQFDYVADCIDTLACKAALVAACWRQHVPIISSLGAGNRLDVSQVQVTELAQTQRCAVASVLRRRLRQLQVPLNYPVVYSTESSHLSAPPQESSTPAHPSRTINGSIAYLPALFGMMIAGVMVQQLMRYSN